MTSRAIKNLRPRIAAASALLMIAAASSGQPAVVPTAEGQIGTTPGSLDKIYPPAFVPINPPGFPQGDVGMVRVYAPALFGALPQVQVQEDEFHSVFITDPIVNPGASFNEVDKVAPAISGWPDGRRASVSFLEDGATSGTVKLNLLTVDFETGLEGVGPNIAIDDIPSFGTPTEEFSKTSVVVDDQGRATVVYTDLPLGMPPRVLARRFDGLGNPIGGEIVINDGGFGVDVALLDPAGNRLVVPFLDIDGNINGNILDTTGASPTVLPEFPISTTPTAFVHLRPAVAADPVSGAFTVAWDFLTGTSGDPSDIRARRFDAQGNPIGDDFIVNTKPLIGDDGAQGQADVAYGPGVGFEVWVTDGAGGGDDTDLRGRAFLPDGTAIGDQFNVNTFTTDVQDHPQVRFLPQPDPQGRPQFAVVWRDVGSSDGSSPRGTGTSYRCFSVDGLDEQVPIFEDGFESGDTSSWSASNP